MMLLIACAVVLFGLFFQDSSAAVTVGADISLTGWGPWNGKGKSDLLYYSGFLKCDKAWLFSSLDIF